MRAREAVAFGLRTVEGVRLGPLAKRYDFDPGVRFREPIERLSRGGWLILGGEVLRASPAGLMIADELAVAFL